MLWPDWWRDNGRIEYRRPCTDLGKFRKFDAAISGAQEPLADGSAPWPIRYRASAQLLTCFQLGDALILTMPHAREHVENDSVPVDPC